MSIYADHQHYGNMSVTNNLLVDIVKVVHLGSGDGARAGGVRVGAARPVTLLHDGGQPAR